MEELHYRHELKFICPENNLYIMENKIRHICRTDSHADFQGTYVIRSLYFDTYDDKCFQERLNGAGFGKKYRIRIYNGNTDVIKLECKHSFHGMKAKETCRITTQQCKQLMDGDNSIKAEASQEILRRFLAERRMTLLTPKVIVEYIRAPYVYAAGNVRVTFDRNIRSSNNISHFLNKEITWRGIMPPETHLLEVKYDKALPNTVMEILNGGQMLSPTSFSKYVLCRKYGMN